MAIYDRAAILDRDNKRKREKKELAPKKPPTEIAKVSDKLKTEQRIHAVLKRDYLKDHPVCECGRPGCKREKAVDIHHAKGRGKYLNVVEFFVAVSRTCHTWIHDNTGLAKEIGLTLSRHEPVRQKNNLGKTKK